MSPLNEAAACVQGSEVLAYTHRAGVSTPLRGNHIRPPIPGGTYLQYRFTGSMQTHFHRRRGCCFVNLALAAILHLCPSATAQPASPRSGPPVVSGTSTGNTLIPPNPNVAARASSPFPDEDTLADSDANVSGVNP